MKNTIYFFLKIGTFSLLLFLVACQNENLKKEKAPVNTKEHVLIVGTYTEKEAHVNGKGEGIYVYKFNAETGELTYQSKVTNTVNPSYLVPHPNRQYLYAVNEIGGEGGTVSAFSIEPTTYQLNLLNKVSSKGNAPCYIDTDGKFVYVANYSSGNVGLFPINKNGKLEEAVSVLNHGKSKSRHPRQTKSHAHFFAPKSNSQEAYAVDLGVDKIFTYQVDTTNQGLILLSEQSMKGNEVGARHLVWHPTKNWLYVINELNGTIEVFKQGLKVIELAHFQTIKTIADSTAVDASSADIHITPNGKFLYASNRGTYNNLAMYQINQKTGVLTFLGNQSTKGKSPRNFVIDSDGQFLLVANQDSDNIVIFKINQETGILEDTGIETKVNTPVCLKFL